MEAGLGTDVHPNYAIADDFLTGREHLALWEAFCRATPAGVMEWNRTYRSADGALRDEAASAGPPELRVLSEKVFALMAGKAPPVALDPWTGFTQSAWTFGAGHGLEWHGDTGWVGSYIYYMHPQWRPSWGGEMLIAAGDAPCDSGGVFIYPRPNRLVVLRGGAMHCIKKVESAAGRSLRASVSGFFFCFAVAISEVRGPAAT